MSSISPKSCKKKKKSGISWKRNSLLGRDHCGHQNSFCIPTECRIIRRIRSPAAPAPPPPCPPELHSHPQFSGAKSLSSGRRNQWNVAEKMNITPELSQKCLFNNHALFQAVFLPRCNYSENSGPDGAANGNRTEPWSAGWSGKARGDPATRPPSVRCVRSEKQGSSVKELTVGGFFCDSGYIILTMRELRSFIWDEAMPRTTVTTTSRTYGIGLAVRWCWRGKKRNRSYIWRTLLCSLGKNVVKFSPKIT